jgi:hypothetical protein
MLVCKKMLSNSIFGILTFYFCQMIKKTVSLWLNFHRAHDEKWFTCEVPKQA